MSTYSLELDFRKPSEGDLTGPAIAQVYIKTHSIDKKGLSFIIPQCVSFQEFDYEISLLEKELKALRIKAKRNFKS